MGAPGRQTPPSLCGGAGPGSARRGAGAGGGGGAGPGALRALLPPRTGGRRGVPAPGPPRQRRVRGAGPAERRRRRDWIAPCRGGCQGTVAVSSPQRRCLGPARVAARLTFRPWPGLRVSGERGAGVGGREGEGQRLSSAISGRRPPVPRAARSRRPCRPFPGAAGQRGLAPPRLPRCLRPGGPGRPGDGARHLRAGPGGGDSRGASSIVGLGRAGLCGLRSERRPGRGPGAGRHRPRARPRSAVPELRVGAVRTRRSYRDRVSPAQQQQNFPACLFLGVTGLPGLPAVKGSAAEVNPV